MELFSLVPETESRHPGWCTWCFYPISEKHEATEGEIKREKENKSSKRAVGAVPDKRNHTQKQLEKHTRREFFLFVSAILHCGNRECSWSFFLIVGVPKWADSNDE